MNAQIASVIAIVLLSLIGVIGDYYLKLSGNGEKYINWKLFVVGFLVYSSTAIGWFFVMKHIKLATLGVVYGVSTVIFLAIVGVVFFKESLNTVEVVGLVLGLASVVLLSRFS